MNKLILLKILIFLSLALTSGFAQETTTMREVPMNGSAKDISTIENMNRFETVDSNIYGGRYVLEIIRPNQTDLRYLAHLMLALLRYHPKAATLLNSAITLSKNCFNVNTASPESFETQLNEIWIKGGDEMAILGMALLREALTR